MDMDMIDSIREDIALRQKALQWIEDNLEEGEDFDFDEICRSVAEEVEYNHQRWEEESLRNAWQQDLIDLYRFER